MTGPGEGGLKVVLTETEKKIVEDEINTEGFSEYINSVVSLNRSLPDYRHDV
jgi:hypothetical protein